MYNFENVHTLRFNITIRGKNTGKKHFHYSGSLLLLIKLIPLQSDFKTSLKTDKIFNQVQQLRAEKYFTLILWTAALSFETLDKDPQTVAALFFTLSRKPQTQKLSTLHKHPPAFQLC